MKIKIVAIVIVFLFIGLSISPSTNSSILDINNKKEFFQDEDGLSINRIEASSPYDYGYKAGKMLNRLYKFIDILARFTEKRKIDEKYVKKQIEAMEQYCPFFLEELRGLSASTNIKIERLLSLQRFIHSILIKSCTVTVSTGKATKYNETFLTQTIDPFRGIMGLWYRLLTFRCWVKVSTLRYKYVFWGIPIIAERPFINEKGLGFGGMGNSVTKNESRYIDEGPGMSAINLLRLTMMTCKNVSEVACLLKNTERSSSREEGFENLAWCDSEGGILLIEYTHNYIITVFGNSTDITGSPEDILWHANHHQWLDPNLTGSICPSEYPSSGLRAERARELLEENYGNITLDVCKKIVRDHGGGFDPNRKDSGDICRHSDKHDSRFTATAWIIQPNLTVYRTRGTPCRFRFIKHDFSKIFEK